MAYIGSLGRFTPYSTVTPLMDWEPQWAPPLDRERVGSYQKYEELYWSNPTAFRLVERGTDINPIYVPNARTVVDSTAHFLMKGMKLVAPDEATQQVLDAFCKREGFYHKFQVAKHSGVVRGDYIFHIMGDPNARPGSRISIESVDPGAFFPVYDDDAPDGYLGVDIVEHFLTTSGDSRLLQQRYLYGENGRITSELSLLDIQDWWDEEERRVLKRIVPKFELPSTITQIPVYHFQNIGWQGQPFGSSELRGFERLVASVNQSASDEEVALALEGLGVYATDAPHPRDDAGNEVPWIIAPGMVLEHPAGNVFKRVDGVGSVKPMQDHIGYLEQSLYEASGTFRPANIDVQIAQSGIALAIKFLPTIAKIDEREQASISMLQQMYYDWAHWETEYEDSHFEDDWEVTITLGEKLPKNPVDTINELNNMYDRGVISAQYYREKVTEELGYVFPDDIDQQILEETKVKLKMAQELAPPPTDPGVSDTSGRQNGNSKRRNRSNNRKKPNESAGTEAK